MGQTTRDNYSLSIRDRIARAFSGGSAQSTSLNPSGESRPCQSVLPRERFDLDEIRRAIARMQSSSSVGQSPPEPLTFRGRVGALIIRAIQRALFWYTPQIVQFHNASVRAQEEQAKGLEAVTLALHDIRTEWQEQVQGLAGRVSQLEEMVAAEGPRNRELLQELSRVAAEQLTEIERIRTESRNGEQLAQLERRMEGIDHAMARLESVGRDVADLRIRVYGDMMARERNKEAAARRRTEWSRHLDGFYMELGEVFRGSCELIKERLTVYLPMVERALAGKQNVAILDIGCGRGEWLELLRDHGRNAMGIDQNRLMVRLCETKGLRAQEGDAVNYLKSLPEGCLDVITAFHVIEHLPMKTLLELFAETFRVLSPMGVAIIETPNPNNLLMSSRSFYLDPTHRNPIPPELGRFLAQTHGFKHVDTLALHPLPETDHVSPGDNAELASRFNALLFGPQDYGIVAWKTWSGSDDGKVEA
jgi:2-polyprenyl-3-methyl-5-hydroxy-6-metoxy-1,4-benzoquinol methylase